MERNHTVGRLILLFIVLLAVGCDRAPVGIETTQRCLAVPDASVWQVVDTTVFVAGVRRCVAR